MQAVQRVAAYTLRYLSSQGERITINGTPTENELVPQDLLGMALQDIQQRTPGKLRGWVEVQATISADAYDSIRLDKNVYLVDVSRSVIAAAFSDDVTTQRLPVEVIMPQIYWAIEDLNLTAE